MFVSENTEWPFRSYLALSGTIGLKPVALCVKQVGLLQMTPLEEQKRLVEGSQSHIDTHNRVISGMHMDKYCKLVYAGIVHAHSHWIISREHISTQNTVCTHLQKCFEIRLLRNPHTYSLITNKRTLQ